MRVDLDTVEERWKILINQNTMVAEDFRARADVNWKKLTALRIKNDDIDDQLVATKQALAEVFKVVDSLKHELDQEQMINEDKVIQLQRRERKIKQQLLERQASTNKLNNMKRTISEAIRPHKMEVIDLQAKLGMQEMDMLKKENELVDKVNEIEGLRKKVEDMKLPAMEDAQVMTEIGADYFYADKSPRISRSLYKDKKKNMKRGYSGSPALEKKHSNVGSGRSSLSIDGATGNHQSPTDDRGRINQDSSTAFGTAGPLNNAESMAFDFNTNLIHDQSVEQVECSPGLRNAVRKIDHSIAEENEDVEALGASSPLSPGMKSNLPSSHRHHHGANLSAHYHNSDLRHHESQHSQMSMKRIMAK